MAKKHDAKQVITFCGDDGRGCPALWLDPDASNDRRVEITDDFGQRVQMSVAQLADLVDRVKGGALDDLVSRRAS